MLRMTTIRNRAILILEFEDAVRNAQLKLAALQNLHQSTEMRKKLEEIQHHLYANLDGTTGDGTLYQLFGYEFQSSYDAEQSRQ